MFKENKPVMRNLLHFGAAFSLGAGIWAMHFIGMLAFKMDMVVTYEKWSYFFGQVSGKVKLHLVG